MKSRRRREKNFEILKIIRAFLEILMRFLGNSFLEILKSFWKLFLEILKTKKKYASDMGGLTELESAIPGFDLSVKKNV